MDDKSGKWPRKGRVTAVYPGAYAVDIEYHVDREPARRVPIMTGPVTNASGTVDLPTPDGDQESGYTGLRDMTAIVDLVDGDPIVIGFIHQRINQMLFDDENRRVMRHASDVYTSIDGDGNYELSHPSGTFIRIGVTPDHEDLANLNHDQNWQIARNTDKEVHVNLEVWNGGAMKAKLHIDPNGNMVQTLVGNFTQNIEGNVAQTIGGTVTANVTGEVNVTTPKATVNGNAEVTGTVKMAGGGGACVTTQSVCAFTGAPHPAGSSSVDVGGG